MTRRIRTSKPPLPVETLAEPEVIPADPAGEPDAFEDNRAPVALPPRPRRSRALPVVGLALRALVGASFWSLSLRWSDFLSPQALGQMGHFLASFFPPETGAAFLRKTGWATLETLAMSLLGTGLAALFGLLRAVPASLAGGVPAASSSAEPRRVWIARSEATSRDSPTRTPASMSASAMRNT